MPSPDTATAAPYRLFRVEVARTVRISPSFLRITFTGEDLDAFGHAGLDQRIKILLPDAYGELPDLDLHSPDWYAAWAGLPDDRRPPMRTYTVRALDRSARELDVDFALHDGPGPACSWARSAEPGQPLLVLGPNAACDQPNQALGWAPPHGADDFVLIGDETAVPAMAGILESLDPAARARVYVELADVADAAALSAPPGCVVTAVTGHGEHGARLVEAVLADFPTSTGEVELADVDIDSGILWEVPGIDPASGAPLEADDRRGERYFWLAGEASVIKQLRRHLVGEAGVDRSAVAFMGYWRMGRTEN